MASALGPRPCPGNSFWWLRGHCGSAGQALGYIISFTCRRRSDMDDVGRRFFCLISRLKPVLDLSRR